MLDKHKMDKHFDATIGDSSLALRRKPDSIAREARLDDIYVVRTSVPAEIVQAYKDLARMERAFRCLKTVDLEIRPLRHWMADRVWAHVFLCMLAYRVEWHLRQALAPLLFHDTEISTARAERASPVRKTEPSRSAKAKEVTGRNDNGQPVMAFADLMDYLGTLARNDLSAPLQANRSITLYTTHSRRSPSNGSASTPGVSSNRKANPAEIMPDQMLTAPHSNRGKSPGASS